VIDSTPGKSVADFIVGSGIEGYATAINNQCRRHLEALRAARQMAATLNASPEIDSLQIAPTFSTAANDGPDLEFESLAPCQKLDVIQSSNKSVPRYIADSGPEEFSDDIYKMCNRHIDNLIEAERILGNF
jgi:hypothetical protein